MKPIMQTDIHSETAVGNCWQACVASLMEIPIEDAFDIRQHEKEDDWMLEFFTWLDTRGYFAVCAQPGKLLATPGLLFLLTGTSPRNPKILHCVIAKIAPFANQYVVVHDPLPGAKEPHVMDVYDSIFIGKK